MKTHQKQHYIYSETGEQLNSMNCISYHLSKTKQNKTEERIRAQLVAEEREF